MFISGPQLPPHQRAPKPTGRSYSGVSPVQSWDKPRLALLPNQAEKPPQSKDTSHGSACMEMWGHQGHPCSWVMEETNPLAEVLGHSEKHSHDCPTSSLLPPAQ